MSKRTDPIERFWNFIKLPTRLHGCWEWTGGLFQGTGYGQFWHLQKKISAHRFSYEHFVGPIPSNMIVCHSCDKPQCINPRHLFLGTNKDNTQDMMRKGRSKFRQAGLKRAHALPEGVSPHRKRFKVYKKHRYIGTFDTVAEASAAFTSA